MILAALKLTVKQKAERLTGLTSCHMIQVFHSVILWKEESI
ncbi:hypothetical protein HMPREF0080_02130 [Anaeroglobus geminatus F0357]|uniref:Uncharacterized protein n=1 Tax=Anaeroglobus geminatus F0357 TaxID=861450 RepID=G9YKC0_9FIRM|nr:hypothetical protein HMPREF0080_02130 [Anaeroglobus geminatus F0357]